MTMRKPIVLTLVLVGLAGCAGDAQTRATVALAAACESYATALDQLTPRKATMKLTDIRKIAVMNEIVAPICRSDSPVDPAQVVGVVQSAVALINSVKGN